MYPICSLSEDLKEFATIQQISKSIYASQILNPTVEKASPLLNNPQHRQWFDLNSGKFNHPQAAILK